MLGSANAMPTSFRHELPSSGSILSMNEQASASSHELQQLLSQQITASLMTPNGQSSSLAAVPGPLLGGVQQSPLGTSATVPLQALHQGGMHRQTSGSGSDLQYQLTALQQQVSQLAAQASEIKFKEAHQHQHQSKETGAMNTHNSQQEQQHHLGPSQSPSPAPDVVFFDSYTGKVIPGIGGAPAGLFSSSAGAHPYNYHSLSSASLGPTSTNTGAAAVAPWVPARPVIITGDHAAFQTGGAYQTGDTQVIQSLPSDDSYNDFSRITGASSRGAGGKMMKGGGNNNKSGFAAPGAAAGKRGGGYGAGDSTSFSGGYNPGDLRLYTYDRPDARPDGQHGAAPGYETYGGGGAAASSGGANASKGGKRHSSFGGKKGGKQKGGGKSQHQEHQSTAALTEDSQYSGARRGPSVPGYAGASTNPPPATSYYYADDPSTAYRGMTSPAPIPAAGNAYADFPPPPAPVADPHSGGAARASNSKQGRSDTHDGHRAPGSASKGGSGMKGGGKKDGARRSAGGEKRDSGGGKGDRGSHRSNKNGAPPDAAAPRRVTHHRGIEYKHNKVPRNKDLLEEYGHTMTERPITTLMVRNIPNRYNQTQFVQELDSIGFRNQYDFVYLPVDRSTESSVGYAFVNFRQPADAVRALQVFGEYRFQRYRNVSSKVGTVSVAHIQGMENNVRHYKKSAIADNKNRFRPLILSDDPSTQAQLLLSDAGGRGSESSESRPSGRKEKSRRKLSSSSSGGRAGSAVSAEGTSDIKKEKIIKVDLDEIDPGKDHEDDAERAGAATSETQPVFNIELAARTSDDTRENHSAFIAGTSVDAMDLQNANAVSQPSLSKDVSDEQQIPTNKSTAQEQLGYCSPSQPTTVPTTRDASASDLLEKA
eukprot:g8612.t1